MRYEVRPLTQEEITRFGVTEEEIAKIREIMGDDAPRVTAPDVQHLRGLRGQDKRLGRLSIAADPVGCSETFLFNASIGRDGKIKPRGFKIPAPPAGWNN